MEKNSLNHVKRESCALSEGSRELDRRIILLGLLLLFAGLGVRTGLLILHGNHVVGSLSGVGDQERYIALADSVFQGRGLSYYGQPTALRPPIYPLLLASSHVLFGSYYPFAVRLFQSLSGIAVAYFCMLIGKNLFGNRVCVGVWAGAAALGLPTLIFVSTELQTEQLATLLTIAFLLFVLGEVQGKANCAVGIGISSGLATLMRFNCAILVIIGALICTWSKRSLRDAAVVCLVSGLIISPWILRNVIQFQGKILFSSHGGINLLEGVVTPDGRAQKGEDERLRAALGWLHTDIEVNNPHRNLFPSEPQLDHQAKGVAIVTWKNLGWKPAITLLLKKTASFWLSTDQIFDTSSFSIFNRILRGVGVVMYWIALTFAIAGWRYLYSSSRIIALTLAFYALFVTLAHLPFVMNSRIRIPFFDPLICILAAGGFVQLFEKVQRRLSSRRQTRPLEPIAAGSVESLLSEA
jgi:4-amino-4-deoxy-L-arabinose transferase-like glycosyltransferase